MAKKGVSKKKTSNSKSKKSSSSKKSRSNSEDALVENFVALQDVMTNLSERFDNLSKQISKLLELFEVSAKKLMEEDINLGESKEDTKEVIKKLDNLIDQNKTIARGLMLLHESNERDMGRSPPPQMQQRPPQMPSPNQPPMQRPMPPNQRGEMGQTKEENPDIGQYRKSISSKS